MQAALEREEADREKAKVAAETAERRAGQLEKIDRGKLLNKMERMSLAGAALEEGVDVYLKKVEER